MAVHHPTSLAEELSEALMPAESLAEMSARKLRKILRKNDCTELRQNGSHLQVKCGGCQTTIPVHGNKDIKKGTLHSIEKNLGICLGPRWTEVR